MNVTDVRHLGDTTTTGLFNQPLGLLQVLARRQVVGHRIDLRTDVDRDDVGAILGQSDRVRPPLAPRCPVMKATFPSSIHYALCWAIGHLI